MIDVSILPSVNASLNATSLFFLLLGFYFIKSGNRGAHKTCMIAAVSVSVLFFISYLTYHANAEPTKFMHTGWIRPVYFAILISHVVLAAAIVPLVIWTLVRAAKGGRTNDYAPHRKIARLTWPVWVYVSVTGILVYMIVYQWFPPGT